ncbi:hypothetical protein HHI36_010170 [Cryptolaemus montrouzieri]|uniref:Uncharacterized protein n=1 Tax=Cryptolaemus montrouzieri TaxID=559131 RepID=A0ABD2MHW9_9CUCU
MQNAKIRNKIKDSKHFIYLNNGVYKELDKRNVLTIINRKYSTIKEIVNKPQTKLSTTSIKVKSFNVRGSSEKSDGYSDIPLGNLIAAVAEKKQNEYVKRSEINLKAFEHSEEILKKAKILNLPPTSAQKKEVLFRNNKSSTTNNIQTDGKNEDTDIKKLKHENTTKHPKIKSKGIIETKVKCEEKNPRSVFKEGKNLKEPGKLPTSKTIQDTFSHSHQVKVFKLLEKNDVKKTKLENKVTKESMKELSKNTKKCFPTKSYTECSKNKTPFKDSGVTKFFPVIGESSKKEIMGKEKKVIPRKAKGSKNEIVSSIKNIPKSPSESKKSKHVGIPDKNRISPYLTKPSSPNVTKHKKDKLGTELKNIKNISKESSPTQVKIQKKLEKSLDPPQKTLRNSLV